MALTRSTLTKVFQANRIEVQGLMSILPSTGSWEVRATLLEKLKMYAIAIHKLIMHASSIENDNIRIANFH